MTCLFCKIALGEIPANVVFEDSEIMVFHDVNPQAPTHLLVIPKAHIATLNDTDTKDEPLLGKMILAGTRLAKTIGFDEAGYRLVFNVNSDGGQTVHHIHLHILAGRHMTWPPG